MFRDAITNYSYGYGIIIYEMPEDAARAIRDLHNFEIRLNKRLKVVYSRDMNGGFSNLYFCNAGEDTKESEIKAVFRQFGEIVHFKLLKDGNNVSKGTGFVRFAKRFQAILAIKALHEAKLMRHGEYLQVKFAEEHGKQKAPIYYNILKKAKNFQNRQMSTVRARLGQRFKAKRSMNFYNRLNH